MTKLFGQLVGAPVQSLRQTGSGFISNLYKDGTDQVLWRDYATTNNNVIGDQVSLGLFSSIAWLDPFKSWMYADAFGTGVTITAGDALHPAALLASRSAAAASTFRFLKSGAPLSNVLWQALGYASDPGGPIELLLTFAGANPANASVAWVLYGRQNRAL